MIQTLSESKLSLLVVVFLAGVAALLWSYHPAGDQVGIQSKTAYNVT